MRRSPRWRAARYRDIAPLDWGARSDQVEFVPFAIDLPPFAAVAHRSKLVELLAVGRRVPSKGLDVMIEALGTLPPKVRRSVHLRIAGSPSFSEAAYLDALTALVARHHLQDVVEFVDSPSQEELWQLYRTSDVVISSSFHEGLCMPIIEGYAFGCRAIGTTSGNLPFIVQPPDPVVAAGDPVALRQAIETMVLEFDRRSTRKRVHTELVARYSHESTRSILQRQLYRFARTRI